jgi:hypothetical protein
MIRISRLAVTACMLLTAASAEADTWTMDGTKHITLHTRDGKTLPIGTIDFRPQGDKTAFKIHLDSSQFTVFFLSMRNFQCIEGPDVECAVPYPYDNPMTATPQDLNWLADNLLFLYKTKSEHAATMANGIRFDLKLTDRGIVGKPQAVNLDDIASPPKDLTAAPYGPGDRDDYPDGSRWVDTLRIE